MYIQRPRQGWDQVECARAQAHTRPRALPGTRTFTSVHSSLGSCTPLLHDFMHSEMPACLRPHSEDRRSNRKIGTPALSPTNHREGAARLSPAPHPCPVQVLLGCVECQRFGLGCGSQISPVPPPGRERTLPLQLEPALATCQRWQWSRRLPLLGRSLASWSRLLRVLCALCAVGSSLLPWNLGPRGQSAGGRATGDLQTPW